MKKENKSLNEQIKRDEENCVPGSLAYDRKEQEMLLEEAKKKAMDGGCVSSK